MSIAQRSVAGEGYPTPGRTTNDQESDQEISPLVFEIDHADDVGMTTDTTNLKWKTFRAEHRAMRMTLLPARARSALAALAQTVSIQRPDDKIFATRATLCGRASLSDRSMFRALTDLCLAGLITRHEQWSVRGPKGYNRAYIQLTEKAIALLGFRDESEKATIAPKQMPGCDKLADPYKKYLSPTHQERQPGTLPADLTRLLDLGVFKNMIFKLMGEATRAGKHLSHIVEMAWHGVKKAHTPVPYLRSLINSNVDFSYQARQQSAEAVRKEREDQNQLTLIQTLQFLAGQTLIDPATKTIVRINADASSADVVLHGERRSRCAVGETLLTIGQSIRSGNLIVQHQASEPAALLCEPHQPRGNRSEHRNATTTTSHIQRMRDLLKSHRPLTASIG